MLIKRVLRSREKNPSEDARRAAADVSQIQNLRRRRRRRMVRLCVFFLAILLLAAGLRLYLRSPIFRAAEIVVEGNRQVSREDVITLIQSRIFRDSWWNYVRGWKHMHIWPDRFAAEDLHLLPAVKEISVRRSFAERKIYVQVAEREPFGIWCFLRSDPVRCVWFDEEGVILDRSPQVEGSLILSVSDRAQDAGGREILPAVFLPNLFSVFRVLEAARLAPAEIWIEDIGLQEMKVVLPDGPDLYFSLRFPSENALGVLQSLRQESRWRGLDYVDFRVENRAYLK